MERLGVALNAYEVPESLSPKDRRELKCLRATLQLYMDVVRSQVAKISRFRALGNMDAVQRCTNFLKSELGLQMECFQADLREITDPVLVAVATMELGHMLQFAAEFTAD